MTTSGFTLAQLEAMVHAARQALHKDPSKSPMLPSDVSAASTSQPSQILPMSPRVDVNTNAPQFDASNSEVLTQSASDAPNTKISKILFLPVLYNSH